jgi:ribosomal protein L12E/L44/L45/RPP1/RPP2
VAKLRGKRVDEILPRRAVPAVAEADAPAEVA